MFGAIVLTFVITFLVMLVLILFNEVQNKEAEKHRIRKENEDLKRRISEHDSQDQRRRESSAYDKGLYDGRGTDALYRQCLKKYMTQDQPKIMINGEEGGNDR